MQHISFNSKSIFHSSNLLKERLREIIQIKQALLREIRKAYGQKEICKVTVDQAIGCMRNVFGLLYDIQLLDSKTITFRDYNVPEIQEYLQKAKNGNEPLPVALFWLLLTGDFPSNQQFKFVQEEQKRRGELDQETIKFIINLPKQLHKMTILSQSVLYLQKDSKFNRLMKAEKRLNYNIGNIIMKLQWTWLPQSQELQHQFVEINIKLADIYSHMMGFNQFNAYELFRMYLSIHAHHEGGNVSTHATHLVGSDLADPYLSYSTGMNGLAGPLHGLEIKKKNQVIKFLMKKQKNNIQILLEKVKLYQDMDMLCSDLLILDIFIKRILQKDQLKMIPLLILLNNVIMLFLLFLKQQEKFLIHNVDAHSGVLLNHYGLKEQEYYTIVFVVSRALGCKANLVQARAIGLPIERPGSITLRWIEEKFEENQSVK
ncbi:unnamed protein product [Paramecium primaurelia]|uniref:Citrate synthase n=1 Tax=Paramecium primaurelia TaxID=5886 RepID=A0A8S1JTP4_PARPR|nr:unnamed protein product [Paramecium primaurelia]